MAFSKLRSLPQIPYLLANQRVSRGANELQAVLGILRSKHLVNQPVAKLPKGALTLDVLSDLKLYKGHSNGPLVSVIMPMYNSSLYLATAVRSVLEQTHANLELLIVDDASTDDSLKVAKALAADDARIRVIARNANGGAYAARNTGLDEARGEFVTVHDADDWSHPKKLEVQVQHLLANPQIVGNLSQAVRVRASASNSFEFFAPRGRQFIRQNVSSLMFRRVEVRRELGYWDEIRFGADSEFHERMLAAFDGAVVALKTGPLAFTRVVADSLTAGSASTHSGIRGVRWFYIQRFHQWHHDIRAGRASAFIDRAGAGRPFAVPQSLLTKTPKQPKFAQVLVGDVTTAQFAVQVANAKKPVALHHSTPLLSNELVHPDLLAQLDFKNVVLLFEGDNP